MSGSVLHKNHYPPLPSFRVITLCSFFHFFTGDINSTNLLVIYLFCCYICKKKLNHSHISLVCVARRLTYQDLEDLSPMEGRETPFSLQMQIAEVGSHTHTGW